MMKKTSIFGLLMTLMMGGSIVMNAADPAYYAALPDGTVLLERPCWVRPDSVIRNDFAWKADSMHYQNTKAERTAATSVKYVLSVNFESYMQQTALWLQDSILGFGSDVYECKSVKNNTQRTACQNAAKAAYPKFYALYTEIVALKEYHPNLYRSYFYRLRPLYYFPELTGYDLTKKGDSYPSGHGYVDWLAAMSLLYLDADSTVKIVQMAHEMNWYRVLFNKHWLSDLDAGNKLASAAFPVLLRSDEYQGLLDATVTEFAAKRTFPTYTDARSHMAKLPDCKRVSDAPFATTTYEWKADSLEYTRGLAQRESARGVQAQADADYTTWLARFSAEDVMGVDITNKYLFPKLQEMVTICREMAEYAADPLRNHLRVAPNTYFAQGATTSSAVSENAYMAWMMGLCLTYVDTAHATVIERTALDIAEGGYILGNYWQSEIENSEKMGSIGFAMAMRNPYFRALADSAILELAKAKVIPTVVDTVAAGQTLKDVQDNVYAKLEDYRTAGQTMDLLVSRTFYCDGYYNTLCMPFAISEADWQDAEKNPLAAGTLKRFVSAEVVNDVLEINIEEATSIEAGVPYLISFPVGDNIVNPMFKGIRITTSEAGQKEAAAMDCQGIFAPYQISQAEASKSLLLGGKNTLYWAKDDGEYLRGFRAYFKVNEAPESAPIRRNMSARLSEDKTTTAINQVVWKEAGAVKRLEAGQVIILRDGQKYNIQGMLR